MTSRLYHAPAVRLAIVIGLIAFASAILLATRASGQETRTLDLEIVFTSESFEVARADGSDVSGDFFIDRGDVLTGQGAVYRAGETDGERIGTFYFLAAATAEPKHVETAANHMFAQGYFELFGEGTLTISGLVNFLNSYTVTITGGTAGYADASGHCVATQTEEDEAWSCTVR